MRLPHLLAATLLLTTAAPAVRAADPVLMAAETSVRLGVNAGYGRYEENVSPQDTEAGALLGGAVDVSALQSAGFGKWGFDDLYVDAGYSFTAGFLRYRGNLQDSGLTPYQAADDAYYNTAMVRLGAGRPLLGGGEMIPYVAGGYQNWYRNVAGPHGASEYYEAGLIGGGLKYDMVANPLLVLSATAEGFAVFDGSVAAPSQEFHGDFGTSAEERVGLDADYRLGRVWHVYAGLGAVHYEYTSSKPDRLGRYEPTSSSVQVDSTVGISYGF